MVRYDTPTDGISRKMFDRYSDAQARKYAKLRQAELDLTRRILTMEKQIQRLLRDLDEAHELIDHWRHG